MPVVPEHVEVGAFERELERVAGEYGGHQALVDGVVRLGWMMRDLERQHLEAVEAVGPVTRPALRLVR